VGLGCCHHVVVGAIAVLFHLRAHKAGLTVSSREIPACLR
jgi:hypothetical protein